MIIDILIVSVVFVISAALQFFIRKLAIKKSLLDLPNERSSHNIPTPRLGGVGISLLWYIFLVIFYGKYFNIGSYNFLFFAFLCGLPVTIISMVDDFINLSPLSRLGIQILCVLVATILISLNRTEFLNIQFLLLISIIIFAGVWFVNLYNFMDGIDGIASVQAIVFLLFTYINTSDFHLIILISIIAGFLVFNWHPAKIFMGDSGSTLLGLVIFICAIFYHFEYKQSIILSLSITSVFWFDASLTLIRRILRREKFMQAHRKHAYQRLNQLGMKPDKINFLIILLYLSIALVYYLTKSIEYNLVYLFIYTIILNVFYHLIIEKLKPLE